MGKQAYNVLFSQNLACALFHQVPLELYDFKFPTISVISMTAVRTCEVEAVLFVRLATRNADLLIVAYDLTSTLYESLALSI